MSKRMLMRRARRWVEHNECPLPLDLAFELMGAGIDPQAVEDDLLGLNNFHEED